MKVVQSHRVYALGGLCISSDIELPLDFKSDVERVSAHLAQISLSRASRDIAEPRIVCHAEPRRVSFSHRSVGVFTAEVPLSYPLVITVELFANYSELGLRAMLQGPISALIAQAAGMVTLHASGVAKGGVGLLIAGASGTGKSTLAAGMARQGWSVISDDLALVNFDNEVPKLVQNSQGVWLCEDSAQAFYHSPSSTRLDGKVRMDFCQNDLPNPRLAGILLPAFGPSSRDPFETLHGSSATDAIQDVLYGPLIPIIGYSQSRRRELILHMLNHIVVTRWTRPKDFVQMELGFSQVEAFFI